MTRARTRTGCQPPFNIFFLFPLFGLQAKSLTRVVSKFLCLLFLMPQRAATKFKTVRKNVIMSRVIRLFRRCQVPNNFTGSNSGHFSPLQSNTLQSTVSAIPMSINNQQKIWSYIIKKNSFIEPRNSNFQNALKLLYTFILCNIESGLKLSMQFDKLLIDIYRGYGVCVLIHPLTELSSDITQYCQSAVSRTLIKYLTTCRQITL